MASEEEKENADVDGVILTNCIIGQTNNLNSAFYINEDAEKPLLTTTEMKIAHANSLLCQNSKEELKRDGSINVNENRPLYRKAPVDGAIYIIVF